MQIEHGSDDKGLLWVLIRLPDYMQHFKASGNDTRIVRSKAGRSFVIHTGNHTPEMKNLEHEFRYKWLNKGMFTTPVECLMVFGKRKTGGRWDSHNQLKAACDFLQRVGIVEDDHLIEATARRRESYKNIFPDSYGSFIYLERLSESPLEALTKTFKGAHAIFGGTPGHK